MSLLQIRSIPLSWELPNLAMPLFNKPVGCLLLKYSRLPIMYDDDENNYTVLKSRLPHQAVKQILT